LSSVSATQLLHPLSMASCFMTFGLFYLLYKYLFLWVLEQPMSSDTGGLFFPKAINHIFVGLYVEQVCLAALFFLAQNENGKPSAVAEGALMIILIVFTIFFQMMINDSYGPLIHSLPLSLADHIGEEPTRSSEAPVESHDNENLKKAAVVSDPEAQNDVGVGKSTNGKELPARPSSDDEPDMKPGEQPDYGFAHPAASRPQQTIWMAKDTLGLSAEEMSAIRERGIDVSSADAEMDAKGNVTIQGPPPDEESRA